MKNRESYGGSNGNSASEWDELGKYAKNAIGNGAFQTVEDFRKEKAARDNYDPEREAWEKEHLNPELQEHLARMESGGNDYAGETNVNRDTGRVRTNNPFDRYSSKGMNREQVSAAAKLRRAFSSEEAVNAKIRENEEKAKRQEEEDRAGLKERLARFKRIKAEREAWENAPQTPLDIMNEDLEDLQYGPMETDGNGVTSGAEASRESNVRSFFRNNSPLGKESLESAEATESYRIPNGGEVNKNMADAGASESVANSGSKANESFRSKNLAWPEKTTDEVMDDAMEEAEDAIENAEETLDTQTTQYEEPKEPAWGKRSKIGELKPDEVEEINRTIAKMAEDEKLRGIMMQKEYESEADHKERLVRMAKTELRWQKLKNAFNESAKHQREDNAKLEKMRERIARARSVVGNIRIGKPSAEATNEAKATSAEDVTNEVKATSAKDAPSAGLIDVENEQRHMRDELAQDIQTVMGAKGDGGENTSGQGRTGNITRVKAATRGEATRDFKVINMPEEAGKKNPETTPRGISMDNLRENFLAEMARRGVKLDEKSNQMKTPKRAEASREFKPINMPEERVGQTTEEASQREIAYGELKNRVMEELARRGMSSEKLEKAKNVLSEYQRQVEHVDDKLNAERDKIVEGKPRSICGRLRHIFGSLAEKRKEKRRKQEEEDRRIFNSWEDDVY